MAQNKSTLAYIALGIGVLALSFSAMFVRWAGVPGPVTAFYRMFLSIFLLFPFFAPRIKESRSLTKTAILFPLLAGAFTACDLGLWTTALDYTTISNATLLGNTSPLWVALGAWLVFRQKLPGRFWLGLLLALSGATLILGTDFILHPRFGIGDVMAIFTGFFYGLYFLFTEKSREHFDSINHIWLVGVGASLTLFIINIDWLYGNGLRPGTITCFSGCPHDDPATRPFHCPCHSIIWRNSQHLAGYGWDNCTRRHLHCQSITSKRSTGNTKRVRLVFQLRQLYTTTRLSYYYRRNVCN